MLQCAQATKSPGGKQTHDNPNLQETNGLKRKRVTKSFAEQSSSETPLREAPAPDAHAGTHEATMMSKGFTASTHSCPADVTVPHKQQRRLLTAMQVSRLQPGDLAQLLKTPSSESTSTTDEPSSVDWDKPSYVCAMPFVSPSLLFPKERLENYIFPSSSPRTGSLSNAPNRSVPAPEEEKKAGKKDQLATY